MDFWWPIGTCSILNLCAISLDRFVHIKDPMSYNRWMTKKIVFVAVSGIWLVSGLVSFVPISLGWHKPIADTLLAHNVSQLLDSGLADTRPQCALDLTPTYAVVSSTIRWTILSILGCFCWTQNNWKFKFENHFQF